MVSFYITISLSPLAFLPFVAATCYNPDGSIVSDTRFRPCVLTAGAISMCCATNVNDSNFDTCLPNGLCHNPCMKKADCDYPAGGQYWRESCTDPSWKSPFCLRACTDPSAGGAANGTFAMSQCSEDGTWCCGRGLTSEACCAINIKDRIVLAETIGVSSSTTSTSLTATSAVAAGLTSVADSGPTSASSLTPTSAASASHSDTGKNTGIGVGVGIGIGAFTVAAIVAFFLIRRRRGRGRPQAGDDVTESRHGFREPELSEAGSTKFAHDTTFYGVSAVPGRQHQELDDHRMRDGIGRPELQEIDASNPQEMPGTPREHHIAHEI